MKFPVVPLLIEAQDHFGALVAEERMRDGAVQASDEIDVFQFLGAGLVAVNSDAFETVLHRLWLAQVVEVIIPHSSESLLQ
jgi:hypothetical protein